MTNCLRGRRLRLRHNGRMERDTYIDEVVESLIPHGSTNEKLAVMAEIWSIFDMLISSLEREEKFDSFEPNMVESESLHLTHDAQIL